MSEELLNKVRAPDAFKFLNEMMPLGLVVPEEELALCLFLPLCPGSKYGLHGVWVDTGIENFSTQRHWCGREILNLFQMEIQFFRYDGKQGHVLFSTAGVRADEIRYQLLAQSGIGIDLVK